MDPAGRTAGGRVYRGGGRGIVIALATLLLVPLAVACSPWRAVESARVVDDIRAGGGESWLKDVRAEPTRTPIIFSIDGRVWEGDLYRPGDGEIRARIVLVPGVTPAGRNDRRLVAFAATLARARFEVLVPDLVNMRRLRVSASDALPIADAGRFLDLPADGKPLGIGAVSFAVGPAVIALFEPGMNDTVDFVLTIGGYYDIEELITFITTGFYRERPDRPWTHLKPNRLGRWVFLFSNADRLDDPQDAALLEDIAERKFEDAKADVSDLVARLGPQGESVYALIDNGDPERVEALIAALPPGILVETQALNLRGRDLGRLRQRFILIHDVNDRVIPPYHSTALTAALPPGQANVFLIGSLQHADPQPPGLIDALHMVAAVYAVLKLRDGAG